MIVRLESVGARNLRFSAAAWLGTLLLIVSITGCGAGPVTGSPSTVGPRLSFPERSHDFGQLSASQPQEYRFSFTNSGNGPLQIDEIRPEPAQSGG